MSPDQKDYGHADSSALVPGSLTVFRHFQADIRTGELAPMNYRPPSSSGYDIYGPMYRRGPGHKPYPAPVTSKVYAAACNRAFNFFSAPEPDVDRHKSPKVDCSCGFYASYDPTTDFYPSMRWGLNYASYSGDASVQNVVLVRAAVEMSGTVVMGRLGVRAEKMKIVALTIDWSKHLKTSPAMQELDRLGYRAWGRSFDALLSGGYNPHLLTSAEEERERVLAGIDGIAARYGAKHYPDMDTLVEFHPQADIEALGVDTTTPPPYEGSQALWSVSAYTQGATISTAFANQLNAALNAVLNVPVQPAPTVVSLVKKSKTTAFEKAIEAKKNRPGPPGSGIDRRKGKLR